MGAPLVRILVLLSGLGALSPAHAVRQCVATSGLPNPITYPATVAVPSSLGQNQTIPGTQRSFHIKGTCLIGKGSPATIQVGSNIVACTLNPTTEVSPGIYTTGISGIGMRLRDGSGTPITNGSSQACFSVISRIGAGGDYDFSGSLELVRIAGAIPAGATSLNPANVTWAFGVYNTNVVLNADNGNIYSGSSSLYPTGSISLRSVTCSASYPPVVNLPPVGTLALPSPGSIAGVTGFSIGVRCDDSVMLGITLDGASTVADAPNGILDVMPGGASGVGLKILDGNGGTRRLQERIALGPAGANVMTSFPFQVAYVRRAAPLVPGSVNGAMVFTFDYE